MKNKAILTLIIFVQFVNAMDFVMVMPMGPDLASGLNFKLEYIAWLTSSYTIAAAVVTLITAAFLDKFDRKKVLLFSLTGLLIATFIGGLSTTFDELLYSRIIAGGFGGISISIGISIVVDVVPEKQRGKALSLVMAGFPLSAIAGIPLALYISEQLSWQWSFYLLASLIALVIILAAIQIPSMTQHRLVNQGVFKIGDLWSKPEMILAILATGLCVFPAFLIVPHISSIIQFNYGFPRESLSFLYLATGIANLCFVLLTGTLVDRLGAVIVTSFLVIIFSLNIYIWFLSPLDLPVYIHHMIFFISFTAYIIPVAALTSKIPLAHQRAGFSAFQSCFQHLLTGASSMISFMIISSDSNNKMINIESLAMIAIATAIVIPLVTMLIQSKLTKRNIGEEIPAELYSK